jgi:hypothetical protein
MSYKIELDRFPHDGVREPSARKSPSAVESQAEGSDRPISVHGDRASESPEQTSGFLESQGQMSEKSLAPTVKLSEVHSVPLTLWVSPTDSERLDKLRAAFVPQGDFPFCGPRRSTLAYDVFRIGLTAIEDGQKRYETKAKKSKS